VVEYLYFSSLYIYCLFGIIECNIVGNAWLVCYKMTELRKLMKVGHSRIDQRVTFASCLINFDVSQCGSCSVQYLTGLTP
jgi:hypothetical protein